MFLSLQQVDDLQRSLLRMTQKATTTVKKIKDQLFYALEPEAKLIHIISEEVLPKFLADIAKEGRKLEKFANELEFRMIPKASSWSLPIDAKKFLHVKSWGTSKTFRHRAFCGAAGDYFDLVDGDSESSEIEFPNIPEGRRFRTREESLSLLFSDMHIGAFLKSSGLDIEPDLRDKLMREFKMLGEKLLGSPTLAVA